MVRWGDPKAKFQLKPLTREDALERGFVPARVSWENYEGECCIQQIAIGYGIYISQQEIRMWLQNERMDIDKNLSSVLNKEPLISSFYGLVLTARHAFQPLYSGSYQVKPYRC